MTIPLTRLFPVLTGVVLIPTAPAALSMDVQNLTQYQVSSGRIISVNGTASVQTAPDKALITVAVKIWDKDLHDAYANSETRVKRILALAPSFHITPQDMQTSEINVSPTYPTQSGSYTTIPNSKEPLGYEVQKTIRFVLKDTKLVPDLLAKILESGATNIDLVQFDASNIRKLKDEARSLAVRAAREKADGMAHDLNAKVGKALVVTETGSDLRDLSRYSFFPNLNNNISKSGLFRGENSETVAPGELMISSSVTITFELTD